MKNILMADCGHVAIARREFVNEVAYGFPDGSSGSETVKVLIEVAAARGGGYHTLTHRTAIASGIEYGSHWSARKWPTAERAMEAAEKYVTAGWSREYWA